MKFAVLESRRQQLKSVVLKDAGSGGRVHYGGVHLGDVGEV